MTATTSRRGPSPWARLRSGARMHRSLTVLVGWVLVASMLPLIVLIPPLSTFQQQSLWIDGFANAGVFILLALGLNVVVGLAGLLDLGYAAFFAIGSYVYAFGDSPFTTLHIPFWPMLLVGAVIAATLGVLLGAPTLRLRGDYLAIVTLGFGEIVPAVFLNASTFTKRHQRDRRDLQAGAVRVRRSPSRTRCPTTSRWSRSWRSRWSSCIASRRRDSAGPGWRSGRTSWPPRAAGVNTVTTKLLAFALGASTAGLAGVFAASKLTIVSPDQFGFAVSFTVLAMVVLGGMGNIWGVAIGAFVLYDDPERRPAQAAQPVLPDAPRPDPAEHRLRPVPVPAVRARPGRDDAAPTRGPLPEPPTTAGAPRASSEEVGDVPPPIEALDQ